MRPHKCATQQHQLPQGSPLLGFSSFRVYQLVQQTWPNPSPQDIPPHLGSTIKQRCIIAKFPHLVKGAC